MRRRVMRVREGDMRMKRGKENGRKKIETKVQNSFISYNQTVLFDYR